jgi:uncharacterized coiled-coil protein SlyX
MEEKTKNLEERLEHLEDRMAELQQLLLNTINEIWSSGKAPYRPPKVQKGADRLTALLKKK